MIETIAGILAKWLLTKEGIAKDFLIVIAKLLGKTVDKEISKILKERELKSKLSELIKKTIEEFKQKYPDKSKSGNFYENEFFWKALFRYNFFLQNEDELKKQVEAELYVANKQGSFNP